jgi:crossover junction endodeoxyribonuclease RusA
MPNHALGELRAEPHTEPIATEDLPRLHPADAAWLLVLVQHAVPSDTAPDSPMNWEGAGRSAAYKMLAAAAGAHVPPMPQPASEPVVWEVRLPWNKPPLSLNDRRQWAEHSRVRREVRDAARWAIRAAKLGGPYELVEVCLHWRPARNNRRDEDNPALTAKVVFDACVDEGLVRDDEPRFMRKLMPEIHPAVPGQGAMVWLSVAVLR